jgi:thiol-disulfide isomerase/thioredoxin
MTERALRVAGAALVVMVGIWAGARIYSSRMAAQMPSGSITVPVGEASAPTDSDIRAGLGESASPAKIPDRIPDFSLGDRNGHATSIRAWDGKSLVINFWATWCAPCRREIPLLEALYGKWGSRDVEVVGIAVDYRDKVLAYADELKIAYPLLIGEQDALDVAAALGVESPAFPFTVFTDRRGEVVALYMGELHQAEADLILSVVQSVNERRVALPEARRSITEGLRALLARRPQV